MTEMERECQDKTMRDRILEEQREREKKKDFSGGNFTEG